jgi:bacterioferritin-associated ferredoxin
VLAVGHGLTPSTDISRLLKINHSYDDLKGGWIPKLDKYFKSSMKGLYIVGDGSGISGAIAAEEKGELAAYSILKDFKLIDETEFENNISKVIKKLKRYEIFAKGIAKLNATPQSLIENISNNTVICRCEDITKKDVIHAVENGARNLNQIKSWTRFGMGPCQGRTCQYSVAKIASEHLKCNIKDLGYLTGRTPLRPFPLDKAIGDFEYEEITKVEAAPL